ncbi:AfsR/SARP family transcriptional regulator [Streptomyces atacamensis]|uniref:AfsR/SARP family transcriptional regulator n=1 Tax=Streptomyces atacamensis TaxID=531966 RepID=UPI00399CCE64
MQREARDVSTAFGLLGPVRLTWDGESVTLGPPQRRAVLAVLLLASGRAVTIATLRKRLWSRSPPASAASAIHVHVHHLRKVLDSLTHGPNSPGERPRLVTHPGRPSDQVSYALYTAPGLIDAVRFRDLADEGEAARARGDIPAALDRLEAALSLWRGVPLPELQPSAFALETRRDLTEMRLDALRCRAACLLEVGLASRAAADLRGLHAEHPDDERTVVLLSTALCRLGADGRALRLIVGELDRWQRDHGMLPSALLRERDRITGRVAVPDAEGRELP